MKKLLVLVVSVVFLCYFAVGQENYYNIKCMNNMSMSRTCFRTIDSLTIINYKNNISEDLLLSLKQKIGKIIHIEDYGITSFVCSSLSYKQKDSICFLLGDDSVYISFTEPLTTMDNNSVSRWTCNEIIVILQNNIDIDTILKKNDIKYSQYRTLDENMYLVELSSTEDNSFLYSNILSYDNDIISAQPNFWLVIDEDNNNPKYNNQ